MQLVLPARYAESTHHARWAAALSIALAAARSAGAAPDAPADDASGEAEWRALQAAWAQAPDPAPDQAAVAAALADWRARVHALDDGEAAAKAMHGAWTFPFQRMCGSSLLSLVAFIKAPCTPLLAVACSHVPPARPDMGRQYQGVIGCQSVCCYNRTKVGLSVRSIEIPGEPGPHKSSQYIESGSLCPGRACAALDALRAPSGAQASAAGARRAALQALQDAAGNGGPYSPRAGQLQAVRGAVSCFAANALDELAAWAVRWPALLTAIVCTAQASLLYVSYFM